jgi:thiosulfate dehydrogenase (quinone) large subunit
MTITKTKIIVMTVIATLLYLLLMNAVDETPFMKDLFAGADWTGSTNDAGESGSWLAWLGLILIPALGLYQAFQLGDREIEVEADRETMSNGQVSDPAWWKAISGNVLLSVIWLPLRFVLGIHWLQAGWHKTQDIGWAKGGMVDGETVERGSSMKGFLMGAITPNPETGNVKAVFGWYADFLKYMVDNNWTSWFGPLVAWGEFLIGVGLLVGGLVGIAAFFGTMLNMSFMLAGTVSSNPWMFAMTVFIILGWKVAGYYGLDRYLLPILGTPWNRGRAKDQTVQTPPTHSAASRI